MYLKNIFIVSVVLLFCSCTNNVKGLQNGPWRGALEIDNNKEIPFLMEYRAADTTMTIINADERIVISDITFKGDSIFLNHSVFEGVFKGVYTSKYISGKFVTPSLDRVVPFYMSYGSELRFKVTHAPNTLIDGNWETVFSPNKKNEKYIAKGIFDQRGNRVTGTFRTTTGDYRYLDGVITGDSLKLSTFDGAHAFLFEAKISQNKMQGQFYSGNHWVEPFRAVKNEGYELPSPDSLTFLKPGYKTIDFAFKNTQGDTISLQDKIFKNKVVLVQIMGTWCPNCLDEIKYFTTFYNTLNAPDFEIVALAFEHAKTEQAAMRNIEKLIDSKNVPYPILLAQYGTSDKKIANDKLPMLNQVLSYPTTIFIDKKNKVRRIHTGFNGPATGEAYTNFVNEFEDYIAQLRNEEGLLSIFEILDNRK